MPLTNPIGLTAAAIVPPPELFRHRSALHGQRHVSRVMVHAFRLVEATRSHDLVAALWGAVYLHDLARSHDGRCHLHGRAAWVRFETDPALRAHLTRGGVGLDHLPGIQTAVTWHCLSDELPNEDPHWPLTSLLKDADGLDRVRLDDLDARYLRRPESRGMVEFAHELFEQTDHRLPEGPEHFGLVWSAARGIADSLGDPL